MADEVRRGPWSVLSSREAYANPWYKVREDAVIRPDGSEGVYCVVECRPAVGIVALTPDNAVYLVGQHRYTTDRYSWEIPAGTVGDGERTVDAAMRELREETGLGAERWTSLGDLQVANGEMNLIGHLFLAESLERGSASPDGTEQITVREMALSDAVEEAVTGEISQAFSVAGLLRAWHRVTRRRSGD